MGSEGTNLVAIASAIAPPLTIGPGEAAAQHGARKLMAFHIEHLGNHAAKELAPTHIRKPHRAAGDHASKDVAAKAREAAHGRATALELGRVDIGKPYPHKDFLVEPDAHTNIKGVAVDHPLDTPQEGAGQRSTLA